MAADGAVGTLFLRGRGFSCEGQERSAGKPQPENIRHANGQDVRR
jgi:hypothetical protein